jgi:hypothetical protein
MAKRDIYQFTVTLRATRYTANKVLEQFIDRFEEDMIERSMESGNWIVPEFSMSVSTLRKCKPATPSPVEGDGK